jgi:apolipoprotein N-acyltransferase
LLRPAQHGITVAVDYNGNVLNQMNFADPGDGILYAELPTQGIHTLYTQIGDVLGWICVVGLLGLIVLSIILRIKLKKEAT